MFTPTLRCECAQPASDRLMRKWCIGKRKDRWKKKARAKEKRNQLIGKKMTFKRLFERGSGGSASDYGRGSIVEEQRMKMLYRQ